MLTDLLRQLVLVYLHVLPTVDVCLERFMTVRAHKRPFVAMRHQVPLHAALRGELRVAHRAAVRPQIVVRMQVRFQDAFGREHPGRSERRRIIDTSYGQKKIIKQELGSRCAVTNRVNK